MSVSAFENAGEDLNRRRGGCSTRPRNRSFFQSVHNLRWYGMNGTDVESSTIQKGRSARQMKVSSISSPLLHVRYNLTELREETNKVLLMIKVDGGIGWMAITTEKVQKRRKLYTLLKII